MYSKSELASYFKGVKDTKDGGFDCLCTCHDDHHPSAHFTIGNKGDWIGNCKTCGANGLDIARVAGANISGLFHNSRPQAQRLSKTQFAYEKNCLDKYPYFAINSGLQTHIKYRMPNKPNGKKDMRQGYDKDGKWVTTLKDIDTSLSVFSNVSIEKLKQAAGQGEVICHCEGEKDCRTAGHYGLIAFTVGGSQDFNGKKEIFKYLKSARLIIFGDNDAPGKECASKINSYYRKLGGKSHVIIFSDLPEGGDLSDFMQTHTKSNVIRLNYEDDMTLAEIGRKLGISRERARQLRENALQRLRTGKARNLLEKYAETEGLQLFYSSVNDFKRNGSRVKRVAIHRINLESQLQEEVKRASGL